MQKHVAIVNFTGFRNNWGCQATSFELMKFMAACFPAQTDLRFSLVPLLSHCAMDLQLQDRLDEIYAGFTAVATAAPDAGRHLALLEDICLRRYGAFADKVKAADVVVFQAEGAMGLGADFARGPRLMLLPFVAKHAWKKTVISLNQSFYAQDPRVIRNAVESFGSFDFTAFREGASAALARASGLTRAAYVPDLAFETRAAPDAAGTRAPRYFAVSGSALKDPDRYRLILDQAKAIQAATGLKPLIALSRDNRMKILSRLRLRPGSYASVPSNLSYADVATLLADSAFILGGRYHMAIMGAAVGAWPMLLPGNSFKNEGLASLLDLGQTVRRFDETDGILADVTAFMANRDAAAERLDASIRRIRANIAGARAHVTALLAGDNPGAYSDTLPAPPPMEGLIERYRKFGSGKPIGGWRVKIKRCIPAEATPQQVLAPLFAGYAADPQGVAPVLWHLAATDKGMAQEITRAAPRLPGFKLAKP